MQVKVIEAVCDDDNFRINPGTSFSVIVLCDNYKYETEEVVCETELFNPEFNHTFHIKITGPDDKVKVILRDNTRFAQDPSYKDYRCTIDLDGYQDLKTHDTWFDIYDGMGRPTKLKIHASIKCNFSRLAYFEENLRDLLEQEEELTILSEELEENLRKLIHPFAFANVGNGGDSRFTSPNKHSNFANGM